MKLNEDLLKILSTTYTKSTMINRVYQGKDLSIKTDKSGNPVLLFIGKRNGAGTIKGSRFVRTLKYGDNGEVLKDHWELKGKAT